MDNAITNFVVYMSACTSELTKQVHFGLAVGTKAFTHDALLFVEYAKTDLHYTVAFSVLVVEMLQKHFEFLVVRVGTRLHMPKDMDST